MIKSFAWLLPLLSAIVLTQDFSNSKKDFYTITMSIQLKQNQKGFLYSQQNSQTKTITLDNKKSKDFYMIKYKLIRNLCLKDIDPIAGKLISST
jgi:hypothetical protein